MINPGVITLASLNSVEFGNFPYRFCIEDNIGEKIHIHYKNIRFDLTIQEFYALAEKMAFCIDELIKIHGFSCRTLDPVYLVGIAKKLPRLRNIELKEIYLEDILVDTLDKKGNKVFLPLNNSRVYKSLYGIQTENNNYHIQFNHFKNNKTEKLSNMDRVLFNLEHVKEHGYPYKEEYILVNEKNIIDDGQHRAACLYFLNGNIKIPVKVFHYENEEEENAVGKEHDLWEKSLQKNNFVKKVKSFIWRIITKYGWCTWNKSEWDKSDMLNRLDDMKNRLECIENSIQRRL